MTTVGDQIEPVPREVGLRAMLRIASGDPWPRALRAAVAMTAPLALGVATGHTAAGMAAGLGGFTALYARDRPYLDRARALAFIAVAFAVAISVGVWTASMAWVSVLVVAVVASLVAMSCLAISVGPPGAYMFAFAFAAGVGTRTAEDPVSLGLLVLAGGGVAWLVALEGALRRPHGPEQDAVRVAEGAVGAFLAAGPSGATASLQHRAAEALRGARVALFDQQLTRGRPGGEVARLRGVTRELQLSFAQAVVNAQEGRRTSPPDGAWTPHSISQQASAGPNPAASSRGALSKRLSATPRERLSRQILLVGLRVLVAALLAGGVGRLLGLAHSYWAVAAAMLVVYRGLDRRQAIEKGVERMVGTLIGLAVAAAVLALHLTGWVFVGVFFVDVFLVDYLISRNYVLAVIFIATAALLLATASRSVHVDSTVVARGMDTIVGCSIGIATAILVAPLSLVVSVRTQIAATLDATATLIETLGPDFMAERRRARRSLRRQLRSLSDQFDRELNDRPKRRSAVMRQWPAVLATERIAQRVLAESWAPEPRLEHGIDDGPDPRDLAPALRGLAISAEAGTPAPPLSALPAQIALEVSDLHAALAELADRPGT